MLRHVIFIFLCFTSLPLSAGEKTLLILGDSLSAGYGIRLDHGWVALLRQRLNEEGYNYKVINSSISGDTTRGAMERLRGELARVTPDVAIVELGGNDGLRGLSLEEMRSNLVSIIRLLSRAGSKVLLIPIQLPPNYGPVYTQKFGRVYEQVAGEEGVVLGRFILEDIAGKPELMQADGIHPVARAQPGMLDNVWPCLRPLLSAGEAQSL